jgi:hypothetical protein
VPEPRPIEDDYSVVRGRRFDQSARYKILQHAPVTMEKNQRRSLPALDIVHVEAVDVHELSRWGIIVFRTLRKVSI